MCNSFNHSDSCRCGFGGEGHLGRRIFGNAFLSSPKSQTFFTLNPVKSARKVGHYITFITPNAHCPVCGDRVYFYQSEYGGRVFFDELGYPWKKHPCTDTRQWQTSTRHIKLTGSEDNQLAFYFIYKWELDGYFPLICKRIEGKKQILGQFLYDSFQDGEKLPNEVSLVLKEKVDVVANALFFIKEISASKGLYELKFCFRKKSNNHIITETVKAKIIESYRPLLRKRQVKFRNYGVQIIKKNGATLSTFVVTQRKSNKEKSSEIICKFCGGKFPEYYFRRAHKNQCMHTTIQCSRCKKDIERHNFRFHEEFQCSQRTN
jgi:hypothetical protein